MKLFTQPMFAVVFGAFILCAETCLHFDAIRAPSHWFDLPIYDWIAGAFLVWTGAISRRDWSKGRPYLAAGWGFMLSLLVGAFVAHWEDWSLQPQADGWVSDGAFVGILAGLLVLAVYGLVGALGTRR